MNEKYPVGIKVIKAQIVNKTIETTFKGLANLFPFFENIDSIVAKGTEINPMITDLTTFVIFAVAPINIIKGVTVSVITILIYKPLRRFIKIQD